ncbi:hypothetical protein KC351_g85 [Hortaea werneckii]|nr:hypothetical protein KC351_g85 [Hortaea werneckii]
MLSLHVFSASLPQLHRLAYASTHDATLSKETLCSCACMLELCKHMNILFALASNIMDGLGLVVHSSYWRSTQACQCLAFEIVRRLRRCGPIEPNLLIFHQRQRCAAYSALPCTSSCMAILPFAQGCKLHPLTFLIPPQLFRRNGAHSGTV